MWIRTGWPKAAISLPDLYQRGPNAIRDSRIARRVVALLEEHGWLVPIDGGAVVNGVYRREASRK